MIGISVTRLLGKDADLALSLIAGQQGLDGLIKNSRIQKPGLALTGFVKHVHPERLQVLGQTEHAYLLSLPKEQQIAGIRALVSLRPCAVVITRDLEVPSDFVKMAEEYRVPLLTTPLMSSVFINRVTKFLENTLAPSVSIHGVLTDVFGVGILLLGKSGIGKSETALDLVLQGHRLVADDVIRIWKNLPDQLYGMGSTLIKHHIEIRGLGILNIKDLFGVAAVRDAKRVELVIELVEWDPEEEYDRLGTEERRYAILDVALPLVRIPVRPGRNISSLVEVAARNQLLKRQGTFSAREFQERLNQVLMQGSAGDFSGAVE